MDERYCPECGRDVLTERRLAASECAECDGWALRYAHAAVRELCTPAPPTRQE